MKNSMKFCRRVFAILLAFACVFGMEVQAAGKNSWKLTDRKIVEPKLDNRRADYSSAIDHGTLDITEKWNTGTSVTTTTYTAKFGGIPEMITAGDTVTINADITVICDSHTGGVRTLGLSAATNRGLDSFKIAEYKGESRYNDSTIYATTDNGEKGTASGTVAYTFPEGYDKKTISIAVHVNIFGTRMQYVYTYALAN
ncbi:MAG: hypothetical protein FWG09_06905 [Synergistaceae bacterium]|nr:hypothetical protein [Synergistaceae bacterium]